MIGNDVVDLDDGDSLPGARHRSFDARVFSCGERELLARSAHPDRTRWVLWAAKESAYKAARRLDPTTVFAPSRFVVALHAQDRATVTAAGRCFAVDVIATRHYVHAVAYSPSVVATRICIAVSRLGSDTIDASCGRPGVAVRKLALAALAKTLGVAADQLAIGADPRDRRIPTLLMRAHRRPIALSLSHHGRFVAFACELPRNLVACGG